MTVPHSERIQEWRDKIKQARLFRERFGDSRNWKTYRDYYRGIFPDYSHDIEGTLPYNITYMMASATVPRVYQKNPFIRITPRFGRMPPVQAKMVEGVAQYLMEELKVKKTMKTAALNCFLCGKGIIKTGYDSEYGYVGEDEDLKEMGIGDTTSAQLDKKKKEFIEYNKRIMPGMPWASAIDPDMVLVPYGTREMHDCRWVDHMVLRLLEDVKKDDLLYKNTSGLQSSHIGVDTLLKNKASYLRKLNKYTKWLLIHELRDVRSQEVMAFTSDHPKFIRGPEEDSLQKVGGLPFVAFDFNEDPEWFWARSDAAMMEPQQLELNEARTQAMLHRRVALMKVFVKAGAIEDEEIEKMLSSGVLPAIKVDNVADIREAIKFAKPNIPADLTQWPSVIREDVRETMGLGRLELGEMAGKRASAREAAIAHSGAQLRVGEKREAVADALEEVMDNLLDYAFRFWDREHLIQMVGYDGARYWVNFSPEEIKRNYRIKVDIESMTPSTRERRRREIIQLMSVLGDNPQVNLTHLVKLLLREYDFVDAMDVLPLNQEQRGRRKPMSSREFQQRQQKLLQSPRQAQQEARQNLEGVIAALEASEGS